MSQHICCDIYRRAVHCPRPGAAHPIERTRYAIGLGAKPATYARRMPPDKVFDRFIRVGMGVPKSL